MRFNLDSIDTNANGQNFKSINKFEEGKNMMLNSINSQKFTGTNPDSICAGEEKSDRFINDSGRKNYDEMYNFSNRKDLFPIGEDPIERQQFREMRYAYLDHKSMLSFCICKFLPLCKDISLEIALFKKMYSPNEQI